MAGRPGGAAVGSQAAHVAGHETHAERAEAIRDQSNFEHRANQALKSAFSRRYLFVAAAAKAVGNLDAAAFFHELALAAT